MPQEMGPRFRGDDRKMIAGMVLGSQPTYLRKRTPHDSLNR